MHRAFHRVQRFAVGRLQHVASGIAQIPRQPVGACVHVTRGARNMAETGGQMRVVQKRTAVFDCSWSRIEKWHSRDHRRLRQPNDRDGAGESIEHKRAVAPLVQHNTCRPCPHGNIRLPSTLGIHHDHVVRPHAGDQCPRAGVVPGDATWIAQRLLALLKGQVARLII